jgi:adenine specific DNA methylase Mod
MNFGVRRHDAALDSTRPRLVSRTTSKAASCRSTPKRATRQPEQIRAFRDTWQFGVNSYLTTLRDRLTVAHQLLTPTGSVFVQIGDENVHLVRSVIDEVFGSENYCSHIVFRKTTGKGNRKM